jgi:uncharacterized protein (DUF433 family)
MDGHIVIDDHGVARVEGTRLKVKHLAAIMQANDLSSKELCAGYPDFKPASIYAALAFSCDHRKQIDAEILADEEFADRCRAESPNRLTREMLEQRMQTTTGE